MPANILADMNSLSAGLEDQRALQIALELTKLGLNDNDSSPPTTTNPPPSTFDQSSEAAMMRRSANMTECVPVPSSEHVAEIVGRQGMYKSVQSGRHFGEPF
jgi:RNA-binding protein MEX3